MNTIKEVKKELTAMDLLQKYSDVGRVKAILPSHYSVKSNGEMIHCVSKVGIVKGTDTEDSEHWDYIMSTFKSYFGNRFKEVAHIVCFCHRNFIIHVSIS